MRCILTVRYTVRYRPLYRVVIVCALGKINKWVRSLFKAGLDGVILRDILEGIRCHSTHIRSVNQHTRHNIASARCNGKGLIRSGLDGNAAVGRDCAIFSCLGCNNGIFLYGGALGGHGFSPEELILPVQLARRVVEVELGALCNPDTAEVIGNIDKALVFAVLAIRRFPGLECKGLIGIVGPVVIALQPIHTLEGHIRRKPLNLAVIAVRSWAFACDRRLHGQIQAGQLEPVQPKAAHIGV